MAHDIIFVENRRTPVVRPKGKPYEAKPSEGKITKRRPATAEEEKVIARGDWVRVNEKGDKPGDSGYKSKKSKVRPQKALNAGESEAFAEASGRAGMLNETWSAMFDLMFAAAGPEADGYDGVTHAGIALVAADTGTVLLSQRADDETDEPGVRQTWEFPGGGLDDGEEAWAGAVREFGEEVGPLPEGEVVGGWRSDDGIYQGFVYLTDTEVDFGTGADPKEVQATEWAKREHLSQFDLRDEVESGTDWDMIFDAVSGNSDEALAASYEAPFGEDPGLIDLASMYEPIPIHGVIAPEAAPSGDGRGFNDGSMTTRPLRLPFSYQKVSIGGHSGSVVIGSMDRMMRKDGLIHWEGLLMPCRESEEFMEVLDFFGGRYGVSVDGDQASFTEGDDGVIWFDAIRAAGLTAVAIPAFHEAYVSLGPHPDMPPVDEQGTTILAASGLGATDVFGGQQHFDRGPGWVTDPVPTKRIHSYWTSPGQPGYAKIAWGTGGDFRRCRVLVGEKIAENSPAKLRYINNICAQWHHDALGYWPGDKGKPGNAPVGASASTVEAAADDIDFDEVRRMLTEALDDGDAISPVEGESAWEAVLVSSVTPIDKNAERKRPPLSYFHQHPSMVEDVWAAESGALIIDEPDEFGFTRTWGYAAERGVCHVGMNGECVEPPMTGSDDYPAFHLGRTKTDAGYISTGVLTYGIGHRDAQTMLSESATQAYFDNIKNAWASVRVGENERGIWFSGVLLPKIDHEDVVKIEASGQVSGEWLRGEMRACLTVNVPGFPNERPTAAYDAAGNVLALSASAFGQVPNAPCAQMDDPIGDLTNEVAARLQARADMAVLRNTTATNQMAVLKMALLREGQ